MNEEQGRAVPLAKDGHNLVFTGSIGCGKTATLGAIAKELQESKNVTVTASTGLASRQVKGIVLYLPPVYVK